MLKTKRMHRRNLKKTKRLKTKRMHRRNLKKTKRLKTKKINYTKRWKIYCKWRARRRRHVEPLHQVVLLLEGLDELGARDLAVGVLVHLAEQVEHGRYCKCRYCK